MGEETAENSRKPVFGVSAVGGKRNFAKVSICVDSDYTSLPPMQASLHGARTTKLKTIDSTRSENYLSAYLSLRPTHIKNNRTSPSAVVFLYRRTDYSTPTITEVALMIA